MPAEDRRPYHEVLGVLMEQMERYLVTRSSELEVFSVGQAEVSAGIFREAAYIVCARRGLTGSIRTSGHGDFLAGFYKRQPNKEKKSKK